jgi:hypothetical protein
MADPVARTPIGAVWVAALSLLVLGGLAWALATASTHAVDARETLERWFDVRELPEGLVIAEAQVLPRGDVAVRLERPGAAPEAPRAEAPADTGASKFEPYDWSSVPIGPPDSAPLEVVIVELPIAQAAADIKSLFEGGQALGGDWKSVPARGGKRVLDRGTLPWGSYAAPYVIEREFESGGSFRDVLRVNLSRERSPRILIARWSRGFPASTARVEALLAALPPRN